MTAVVSSLVYLAIAVPLTVWVAGLLSRNRRVVLAEVLADEDVARAVNQLLVVGFHLIVLGAVLHSIRRRVQRRQLGGRPMPPPPPCYPAPPVHRGYAGPVAR